MMLTRQQQANIKEAARRYLTEGLEFLLDGTRCSYEVRDITLREIVDQFSGRPASVVIADLETDDSALLLGQFVPFEVGSPNGYHVEFLNGYVSGLLLQECPPLREGDLRIELQPSDRTTPTGPYRYLSLEEAKALGLVGTDSAFARFASQYGLKYVLTAGSDVSGPEPQMLQMVEELTRKYQPEKVLDVFAGTGAMSLVALANGVSHVTCVDRELTVLKDVLQKYEGRFTHYELDVFEGGLSTAVKGGGKVYQWGGAKLYHGTPRHECQSVVVC